MPAKRWDKGVKVDVVALECHKPTCYKTGPGEHQAVRLATFLNQAFSSPPQRKKGFFLSKTNFSLCILE